MTRLCAQTDLKEGGFTLHELKTASFTPKELKEAGFSAGEMSNAGFSGQKLKDAGFSPREIKNAGLKVSLVFALVELKDAISVRATPPCATRGASTPPPPPPARFRGSHAPHRALRGASRRRDAHVARARDLPRRSSSC